MKKLIVILASSWLCFQSNAQLERGKFLVGGSVTFKHEKVNDARDKSKRYDINVSPMAGVFIVKKLAAGMSFSYKQYRSVPLSATLRPIKTYSFSYSPFLRYYILSAQKSYNILTQVSYNHTRFTEKFNAGAKLTDAGDGFTLSAGPVIFLSPQIALEFLIGYREANRPFDVGNERTILSSLALQVHLGQTKK